MSDSQKIADWLVTYINQKCKVPIKDVDSTTSFDAYGVDSLMAVTITNEIGAIFGVQLEPTALFEFNTIESLVDSIRRLDCAKAA